LTIAWNGSIKRKEQGFQILLVSADRAGSPIGKLSWMTGLFCLGGKTMKKANSITVIIVIVLTVGSLALGASSDIEKKLENIYIPQLQEQLGISSSQARSIFRALLEKAKEESLEEGTLNRPENLGDILLDKESTDEETRFYLAKMRKEGVVDEDIRWWWNRHDLERRMMTTADEWFQHTLYLKFIEEDGLSRNEAPKRIRKFYPIYGDPDDTSVMTGEDRPLPIELKLRVNIYMTRRRQADSEQFIKDLEKSSSFNALIRREIKKGGLERGQLVSRDVIRPRMRYAFWKFSIPLFIEGFIFTLVFSLATFPLMLLTIGLYEIRRGLSYLVIPPAIALNVYILGGWAAICATRTVIFKDYATHVWLYYVVGFLLCHGPLGYMAAKEGPEGQTPATCLYTILTLVAFIAFCIWPRLTAWPYGWFLDWLYRI